MVKQQEDLILEDALHWQVDKRWGDWTAEDVEAGIAPEPYETIEGTGNLLMYGGASCLWQCLIGNGTGTAGNSLTYFNNGNAAIGVGNNSTVTAAVATQTDLQGASKTRKGMDATYPQHTNDVVVGSATITFKSTFGTSDANYTWAEWGVFNSPTLATGRMLNRKVPSPDLGTKTSAASWTFTVTLTLG